MEDIRRFYRQDCKVPCRFQFLRRSSTGELIELSFDKALIGRPAAVPPLGAKIVLRVAPFEKNVTISGTVIYLQKQGKGLFGVKFSGTCEENLKKLKPVFAAETDMTAQSHVSSASS